MVTKAKECNFNALFVQVRKRGNAYYKSGIEPVAKDVAAGYDPLADIIAKAHAAGLEVHAWVVALQVLPDEARNEPDAPERVQVKHPEWLMKTRAGKTLFGQGTAYLDPCLPEVQKYLISIFEEIVKNYEVDGIHYDRAAYPGREAGYADEVIARFNKEKGREGIPDKDDKDWCAWRTEQLSRLMRSAYRAATEIKPKIKVSASVYPNVKDAQWNRLQDWPGWLNEGCLDFAVPMLFAADRAFTAMLADLLALGKVRPVYIGLGSWQMPSTKAVAQIEEARKAGAAGVVVYSYAVCSRRQRGEKTSFLAECRKGPFAEPAGMPGLPKKQ